MTVPFFSVVLPTRNRLHTLIHTLRTCIDQIGFDDYEIIVSDNGDDEETGLHVAALTASDARAARMIRYHRQSRVVSMTANFDDAISQARGRYLIVLGSDDGLVPRALQEIARLAEETGQRVIRWRNGTYTWPDMGIAEDKGYLGFSLGRRHVVVQGRPALEDCLATFRYEHLPMLYISSAVERTLIEEMRGPDGRFYGSRSCDVYSAIVLSYRCGSYLDVSVPFSLAGLSGGSTGVSYSFSGSNQAPGRDYDALNAEAGLAPRPHLPGLPFFPVVVIAESFYDAKAVHFPDDDDFILEPLDIVRGCIERASGMDANERAEILRICAGDPDLEGEVHEMLKVASSGHPVRLRPERLGHDGSNLHLDAGRLGVATVADAVALVDAVIWPEGAPLRYDLEDRDIAAGELVRRSADLSAVLKDIGTVRCELASRTERLDAAHARIAALEARWPRRVSRSVRDAFRKLRRP